MTVSSVGVTRALWPSHVISGLSRRSVRTFTWKSRSLSSSGEASVPAQRSKKNRGPDAPHVLRRVEYQRELTRLRKGFSAEIVKENRSVGSALAEEPTKTADDLERKTDRADAETGFKAVLELREQQRQASEERKARGLAHWRERRDSIDSRRLDLVMALSDSAKDWVTNENIGDKVDVLLDEFFINADASEHARTMSMSRRDGR